MMLAGNNEHDAVECWKFLQSSTATWLLLSLTRHIGSTFKMLVIRWLDYH